MYFISLHISAEAMFPENIYKLFMHDMPLYGLWQKHIFKTPPECSLWIDMEHVKDYISFLYTSFLFLFQPPNDPFSICYWQFGILLLFMDYDFDQEKIYYWPSSLLWNDKISSHHQSNEKRPTGWNLQPMSKGNSYHFLLIKSFCHQPQSHQPRIVYL